MRIWFILNALLQVACWGAEGQFAESGAFHQITVPPLSEARLTAGGIQAEVAHVVLAWYLTRDSIDVLIPGAKKPEQVLNNLQTLKVRLTVEEIAAIDRIFQA
ncbi:aldo/keto reductase [Paenibacillus mesophilus]|nr:aldo/keto reductase [Paenibacillus mesophilus]